jgi:hypothetical protein
MVSFQSSQPFQSSVANGSNARKPDTLPAAHGILRRGNRLAVVGVPEADPDTRCDTFPGAEGVQVECPHAVGMVRLSPLRHSRREKAQIQAQ